MTAPPKPWELNRSSTISPSTQTTPATTSQVAQPVNTTPSTMNSTYRRPMTSSLGYRSGLYGGMGYGGMGYSGMGYGSMGYGSMGYGGMGYGMGYRQPSKGMLAIERFSMLVNSMCFTAETIEHSMNSMKMFWDTLVRIKAWGAGGLYAMQKLLRDKLKYYIQYVLYLLGRGEKPNEKDGISIRSLVLNAAVCYILILGAKFLWSEITKPGEVFDEEMDLI